MNIKKWTNSLWSMLLGTALLGSMLTSCVDDEFPSMGTTAMNVFTRSDGVMGEENGLVQQDDGYWRATRRVPLVGTGRVVNNISESLASLGIYEKLEEYEQGANNLVDYDLTTTTFSPTAILDADVALNQIVSILDLNYDYAGGQKAGFVIKNNKSGLLDVKVLTGLWLDTYLNGEATGEHIAYSDASSLVDLGLGNIAGGNGLSVYTIEGTFSKPFDEIRLGASGIQLSVIQDIEIMYAYVGENPMIPAVNNGDALSTAYFNNNVTTPKGVSWAGGYQDISLGKLIDGDLDNGITIELVSGVFQPRMTVDFGRKIPAGSEIGFYVTGGELANIGLGSTTVLTTYNGETEAEEYSRTGVVDLKLLGGGVTVYSMITTEECDRAKIEFKGLNLKLGAIVVHYAFVREPTTIDVSSYFTLTNATVYTPVYRFADVPDGVTVKYDIVSHPSTADNIGIQTPSENEGIGYLLTGLTVAGNYVIKATYTDAKNNTSEQTATITRMVKPKTDCNTPLINDEDATPENAEYTAYIPDGFDGIVIGGTGVEGDVSAVTDHNIDNSIQYTTDVGITLAQDQGIIGVKKNNGSIHTGGSTVRTGFVINNKSHLLGLDALRFMRIRLLNNNVPVSSELADENNGVSLSLIDETSNLVRLSIDTDEEFDAIELYTSGLIELKLGTNLSVYYAFIEDANQDCGNPGEECMQLITNANYGAMASIDTKGLLDVGVTVMNLGNMVDGNMDTYASVTKPVDLATETTITVTFNTIKKNQEVGFILSGITGLTNVNLIGIMDIKAFYNDTEVLDNTGGGLLKLKLIGNGDKSYISITPPEDFNKLQLINRKGVGALNYYRINGVYLRPDFDGDGVMDCVTDDTSTEITDLKVIPSDICLGDGVEFDVSGGVEGVTYTLVFINKHSQEEIKSNVTINTSGGLDFINEEDFYNLPAGEYYISVEHGSYKLNSITELTIHPNETTWRGTTSADWNDWDNWSEGTPWDCTNVFIPNTVENYPNLLTSSASKEYRCNNIHFASDAELIGQNHLRYTGKVFFDKTLEAGNYQLLSMPLQGMVTGDMFVASNVSEWETWRDTKDEKSGHSGNYFLEINDNGTTDASNYKESRTNPLIYQRFWSKDVTNKSLTRASYSTTDAAIIAMNDWSRSFNAVGTPYALGQGFAVKLEGSGSYHFHFPKSHNEYHYYDAGGNYLNESDPTDRKGQVGHFILESLPKDIPLSRDASGELYLFGNPLMSHINIKKFLAENSSVTSVKVYKGGEYVDITNDNVTTKAQIAPMQAVFLVMDNAGTDCSVTLTEDMLEQGNKETTFVRTLPKQLKLRATANGYTASCTVALSSAANDNYDSHEDAVLLVGSEEGSGVAVFTAADGKALSIQRLRSATRIPVGFYLKQTGDVSLTFDASDNTWNGWKLKDEQTGRSYPINGRITLNDVSTGSGRFFLEKLQ